MQKSIFFSIVGLCIASAAALQLWLYSRLDGVCECECEDQMLGFAPSVAGGCLAGGSFLSNMLWLLAKRRQWPVVEKLSLFVWVVIITGGLVAVGAICLLNRDPHVCVHMHTFISCSLNYIQSN